MPGGVGREQLGPGFGTVVLEHEVDGQAAGRLVLTHRGRFELIATEQRWEFLEVDGLAFGHLGRAQGHEVELAGLPDQAPDVVDVGDARQLDHDAVAALDDDDRLRHAGRVHATLDDVLDDAHRLGRRVHAILGQRLVLDAETALEVEPELRLDRAPRAIGRGQVRQFEVWEEVDQKGEHADQDDENGTRSTHTGGMLHERPP